MKYNKNKGNHPKMSDRVTICHTDSNMDGKNGTLVGMVDDAGQIGIVLLDSPVKLDVRSVAMPIVCLKQTFEEKPACSPMEIMIETMREKVNTPCEYGHSDIGDIFITFLKGEYTYEEAMKELSYF